jgi:hypothetical protein
MSKEELSKNLKQLVKEGTLKETSQGYVFVAKNDNKLGFKPTTPNKVRFVRNDEYIKFKPKAPPFRLCHSSLTSKKNVNRIFYAIINSLELGVVF